MSSTSRTDAPGQGPRSGHPASLMAGRPTQNNKRQSGVVGDAWSGLLVDGGLSDDSDSDDSDHEGSVPSAPRSVQLQQQSPFQKPSIATNSPAPVSHRTFVNNSNTANASRPPLDNRTSWTTRAAAVGSRPPDTASQNPPSLKLLGLKNIKEGGQYGGASGASSPTPLRGPALEMRHQIEQRQRQEQALKQEQEGQLRGQTGEEKEQPQMHEQRLVQNQRMSPLPNPQEAHQVSRAGFEMISSPIRRQDDFSTRSASPLSASAAPRLNLQAADPHRSLTNFGTPDGFGGVSSPSFSEDHAQSVPRAIQNEAASPRGYQLRDQPSSQPLPLAKPEPAAYGVPRPSQPDSRRALTQQLGLESRSSHNSSASHTTNASPRLMHQSGSADSFSSGFSGKLAASSKGSFVMHSPQYLGQIPKQPAQLTQRKDGLELELMQDTSRPHTPLHAQPASARSLLVAGNPMSLRAPSPNGEQSPQVESVSLQRGAMPPPMPIALPSPVHPSSVTNGPQSIPAHARQPPTSFSDAAGPQPQRNTSQRRSMFRRSMAFFKGPAADEPQGAPRAAPSGQPGQPGQRKSLFRRSVMLLTGRGASPMPQSPAFIDDNDPNAPQPRVRGFVNEKPRDRRSTYLGGGGMGDEWDVNGYGARFWKRFSLAQHMYEQGAFRDVDATRTKVEKRRKLTLYGSLIGGVLIIVAVVAIVIWRENVKTSSVPPSLDRNTFTATTSSGSPSAASTGINDAVATPKTRRDNDDNGMRRKRNTGNSPADVVASVRTTVASVHPLARAEDAAVHLIRKNDVIEHSHVHNGHMALKRRRAQLGV